MVSFYQRFFDGNGSFFTDRNNYITCAFVITCYNKKLIDDFCKYFENVIGVKDFNLTDQNNARTMRTTSKDKCYKIYNHIYNDATVYLDRKNKLIQTFLSEYSPQCE